MRCVQTSTSGRNVALLLAVVAMLLAGLAAAPAGAQQAADASSEVPPQPPAASSSVLPQPRANQYSSNEVIDAGHHFFGGISRGLASIVEKAVSQWGLPNGYILGEEASGAFIGGLRYGEGRLYTKNAGDAARVLAGALAWLRCWRRRRAHHDAGLQPAANRRRFSTASAVLRARPISSAVSA